jgi:hypothetical protein
MHKHLRHLESNLAGFTDLLHHYLHKRSSCGTGAGRVTEILIEEWNGAPRMSVMAGSYAGT